MKIRNHIIIILLLTLIQTIGISQKLDVKNIEQIALATDRTLYLSGDQIWFSATYSIPSNATLFLSKVLYVELFNDDGQVVASQKLAINDGVVNGSIKLPEHLITGNYILRAYTRYQENFPSWQFTTVILSVVNPFHPLEPAPIPKEKDQYKIGMMNDSTITFVFKEPLNSKVKSVNLLVNGISVGADVILYANGLGSINQNVSDEIISLKIMLKSGDSILTTPIAIGNKPYKIYTTLSADELTVILKTKFISNKGLEVTIENLTSLKSIKHNMYFSKGSATTKIPIKKTGYGLILISFKTLNGETLAQTVCYIHKNEAAQHLFLSKNAVASEEPMTIDLSIIESSDYPIVISMVKHGTNYSDSDLLPSFLIDNPLYLDGTVSRKSMLSNELMNQISIALSLNLENITKIVNEKEVNESLIIPELYGLTLQGTLINPDTEKPIQNELIYASVLGNEPQFHAAKSFNNGRFVIPLNYSYDEKDIYLGTNIDDIDIRVDDGFSHISPHWETSYFVPDTSLRKLITSLYINSQINKLFNTKRPEVDIDTISTLPIFGNNLKQIKLSNYIQLDSTSEIFNELVPNVRAKRRNGHYELVVYDDNLNIKYDNPLVLVDFVPYNNIDRLMELHSTEIAQVSVSNHEYVYGNILFKGIITIGTNTDNFAGLPLSNTGVFLEYITLKPDMEFIPFLQLENVSEKPNFANTVFWKLLNNKSIASEVTIIAPQSIAEYDLFVISLKSKAKIIGSQKINVTSLQ